MLGQLPAAAPTVDEATGWLKLFDTYGLAPVLLILIVLAFLVLTTAFLSGLLAILWRLITGYLGPAITAVSARHTEFLTSVENCTMENAATCRLLAEKATASNEKLDDMHNAILQYGRAAGHALRGMEQIPECEDRRSAVAKHTDKAKDVIDTVSTIPFPHRPSASV
jgi:hypothetical protein